jgi:ABC-type multidrug transport system, ATPase component
MNVLEVKEVYKSLGKREIIKGISFSVKEGEIFGFLGPNGAGKTTTIRMLVGLIAPSKGNISIVGHDISKEKELALSHVGAVVENPEMYTYLSGRENLMQIARIRKIPKEYVEEVISVVNLSDRIDDKVRKYSLGMKQRLGLASALLSKPKLLILDEPTNGLDPTGILDFREIVRRAAKEMNTAVFVSSHILSEVQELCDTVAFINNGKIQAVESITGGIVKNDTESLMLITREAKNTLSLLEEMDTVKSVVQDDNTFNILAASDSSPEIISKLVQNGIEIKEIFKKHKELEERYMELVEGGKRVC